MIKHKTRKSKMTEKQTIRKKIPAQKEDTPEKLKNTTSCTSHLIANDFYSLYLTKKMVYLCLNFTFKQR